MFLIVNFAIRAKFLEKKGICIVTEFFVTITITISINIHIDEIQRTEYHIHQSMEEQCSLYVGDLDPSVTEEQLIQSFSKIQGYISAVLCPDTITGRSLCYGYVNFFGYQHGTSLTLLIY